MQPKRINGLWHRFINRKSICNVVQQIQQTNDSRRIFNQHHQDKPQGGYENRNDGRWSQGSYR